MMNRLWLILTICLLLLVACGGNAGPPAGNNGENQPAAPTETAEPSGGDSENDAAEDAGDGDTEDAAADSEDEEAGAASATASSGEENGDAEGEEPAVDNNPAGLPVNPDPVVPGEPFIVEGVIVNASMIPVDAPQFLIDGDNGVRYRLNSQPADEIFTTAGGQLLPHQYGPGVRVRATALLPAGATAADVAVTEDLIVILEE